MAWSWILDKAAQTEIGEQLQQRVPEDQRLIGARRTEPNVPGQESFEVILPEYSIPRAALSPANAIPLAYWNLSGALFAYLYVELAKQSIDVVAASQLLGDPKENPGVVDPMGIDPDDSIPLMDWRTGRPNARFRVLKLLNDNFGPGDRLVSTQFDNLLGVPPDTAMQAFVTPKGKNLLVINKRAKAIDIDVAAVGHVSTVGVVDVSTGDNLPRTEALTGGNLHLAPFAVAVVRIE